MKNMKKLLALLMAVMMLAAMAACGNNNDADTNNDAQNGTEQNNTTDSSDFDGQIHFAGSSSLAPVIASIGSAFLEEYGTWDKVDASLPAKEIDIAVTSGGYQRYFTARRKPSVKAIPSIRWLPTPLPFRSIRTTRSAS